LPAIVHLGILAPGDFVLAWRPAVKPTVQGDERQCLRDHVIARGRCGAGFFAFAVFDRALVLDPAA
jgi:hypothetical protein